MELGGWTWFTFVVLEHVGRMPATGGPPSAEKVDALTMFGLGAPIAIALLGGALVLALFLLGAVFRFLFGRRRVGRPRIRAAATDRWPRISDGR